MKSSPLYMLTAVLFVIGCASGKSSGPNISREQLESINLGKDHTAVVGKVKTYTTNSQGVAIELEVLFARQGGATAPIVTTGTVIKVDCSPIFIRAYEERQDKKVKEQLTEGTECLLTLTKSIKDLNYNLNDILITTKP